jgi:hypothetical protein
MDGRWTTKEACPLTCSGASCTAVCMANVPCTQGIAPCHRGATFCATPTSTPICNDSGLDDSKGGCTGGKICNTGQCVTNPCEAPSAGNLVANAGFDSSVWPRLSNNPSGLGSWNSSDAKACPTSGSLQVGANDAPSICIGFGPAATLYAGYMVNRSTSDGQLGCFVEAWYTDTACQDAWDYGNETGLTAPNLVDWQQVSTTIIPPPTTKSLVLQCLHTYATTAPFLVDRFYLRTSPGGF